MIAVLVTRPHSYTVTTFLASFGRALRGRLRFLYYDRALSRRRLPRGVWIFADLERLPPAEAEKAARLRERLVAEGSRVLNHPTRSLRRYELLRLLRERGENDFDAVRVTERRRPGRFPVFLRPEHEHTGSLSPLLGTQEELDRALAGLDARGESREGKLVVEFLDLADAQGVYRKYAAFRVGGAIVPRHLFFSRDWLQKEADLAGEALLAEERAYLESNPHAAALLRIFDAARIEYGRADYGVKEGRLQLWEINTNPMLVSGGGAKFPERRAVHERAAAGLAEAFLAL